MTTANNKKVCDLCGSPASRESYLLLDSLGSKTVCVFCFYKMFEGVKCVIEKEEKKVVSRFELLDI